MIELLAYPITLFFLFMFGHALADFGLQTEFVGKYKFRKYAKELPTDQKLNEVWPYCLFFHSMIHGGFVWLISGSVILGTVETLLHALIDFAKCEGYLDVHQDQWLHIFCKIFYVFTILFSAVQCELIMRGM